MLQEFHLGLIRAKKLSRAKKMFERGREGQPIWSNNDRELTFADSNLEKPIWWSFVRPSPTSQNARISKLNERDPLQQNSWIINTHYFSRRIPVFSLTERCCAYSAKAIRMAKVGINASHTLPSGKRLLTTALNDRPVFRVKADLARQCTEATMNSSISLAQYCIKAYA